jgi:[phosphatase 2A protein]-leucine-carboxy methyltransferase
VASSFKLLTCDVRDAEIITAKLTAYKIDRTLPTLLITECLMIYMPGAESLSVYNWVRDYFTGDLATVNYEMINPDDPFGRMMV